MKQSEMILKHMQDFGSITPAEAVKEYGCYRLSARIHDLREEGYDIASERCITKNRYGNSVAFAKYRINNNDE